MSHPDSRDYWLMTGDDECAVFHSELAVSEHIRDYPDWWTRIVRFNLDEGTVSDVTLDFEHDAERELVEAAGYRRHVESFRRPSGY